MSNPIIRFRDNGEIYPSWTCHTIGEIAYVIKGDGISKSDVDPNGSVACIQYGDLFRNYGDAINETLTMTDKPGNILSKHGDILMPDADVTPNGLGRGSAIMMKDVSIGYHINIVRPGDKCDPRFLCLAINARQSEFQKRVVGTTIKMLYPSEISKVSVSIPSLPEQRRIADALSAVDTKIDLLTRKRNNLARFKAGLMQKIFSQEVRFTREDGSAYPDWEEKKIGDIGDFKGGGTPSTKVSDYWNGSVPWVSSQDVIEGDINCLTPTRFITEKAINSSPTTLIPANSILLVTRVGAGKVALNRMHVCLSQDFTAIIPIGINSEYLAYWFQCHAPQIAMLAQGTTIKGITLESLKAMTVSIANCAEQEQIATCLSSIDRRIDGVRRQISNMQSFKKGLLQQMFV